MRRQRPLDVNLWLPTRQTHAEYFGQREFRSGDVGRAGASVFRVWPVLYHGSIRSHNFRRFLTEGGLISFGIDQAALYRLAASYVATAS